MFSISLSHKFCFILFLQTKLEYCIMHILPSVMISVSDNTNIL